ncbi:MAG: LysM peptidoglycan-binding domain-containing protein [Syntrophorhabdaceae bacterium]|nr:LysM peptidoglycan-binding domain-containing protein [Syntrophorhabdaceae bacterium]
MKIRRLVIPAAVFFLLLKPCPADPSATYLVKEGDTLYKIAKRFHVSTEEIRAENGLKSNMIRAGKSLKIPEKKAPKRIAESPGGKDNDVHVSSGDRPNEAFTVDAPAGPPQIHMVRRGDTLWSLSSRYGVRVNDLRRINRMREGKRLRSGALIVIRRVLPETYTVEEGDSLAKIARKFGMEVEELMVSNGLDSDILVPGRRIVLFGREDEPGPDAAAEQFHAATEEEPAGEVVPQGGDLELARDKVVRVAKKMLFTPYAWGGTSSSGVDCSGFVWKVFDTLDMKLPRSAREQYLVGMGVDRDKLSVGDLVFFRTYARYPSHVGIYLGDDKFIHASSWSRCVKITSIDHPYYKKRYIGARRLFFDENEAAN